MNWPKEITIVILDKISHTPIPNIIFRLEIVAQRKNNFSIGYFITDKNGKISLSLLEISRKVEYNKKEYPMDYAGDLLDFKEIIIEINKIKTLRSRFKEMAEFNTAKAARLESLLSGANNDKVKSISKKNVVSRKITVKVERLGTNKKI